MILLTPFCVTNNRVYNDAFRTFNCSMQQSVSFTYYATTIKHQKIRIILSILDFKIRNGRQSKRLLANMGRFLLFSYLFFSNKTRIGIFFQTSTPVTKVLYEQPLQKFLDAIISFRYCFYICNIIYQFLATSMIIGHSGNTCVHSSVILIYNRDIFRLHD